MTKFEELQKEVNVLRRQLRELAIERQIRKNNESMINTTSFKYVQELFVINDSFKRELEELKR